MAYQFFYDAQVRRFIVQFMRIFSDLKIETSEEEDGTTSLINVDVRWGGITRQVGHILRDNSENKVLPGNLMAAYMENLELLPEYRKNPYHVDKKSVVERDFDYTTNEYSQDDGHRFNIERYMPVPYKASMRLDILTSNQTAKFQLCEQILTIFNPSITLQHNSNPLDWTNHFEVRLTDVDWSPNISLGSPRTEEEKDIASLSFDVFPVWINPPAKVKRQHLIEQININVAEVDEMPDEQFKHLSLDYINECFDTFDTIIVTPGNHSFKIGMDGVASDEVRLLTRYGKEDSDLSWKALIKKYGEYVEGESKLFIKTSDDLESFDDAIVAYFFFTDKSDTIRIEIDKDTLPINHSISPITAIVNPLKDYPGEDLPAASSGQKYMVLNDIPQNTGSNPWGTVFAKENDIIEYDGSKWHVVLSPSNLNEDIVIKNNDDGELYRYDQKREQWINALRFVLEPGYLRVSLNKGQEY